MDFVSLGCGFYKSTFLGLSRQVYLKEPIRKENKKKKNYIKFSIMSYLLANF